MSFMLNWPIIAIPVVDLQFIFLFTFLSAHLESVIERFANVAQAFNSYVGNLTDVS